jgi:hypothetical protein
MERIKELRKKFEALDAAISETLSGKEVGYSETRDAYTYDDEQGKWVYVGKKIFTVKKDSVKVVYLD